MFSYDIKYFSCWWTQISFWLCYTRFCYTRFYKDFQKCSYFIRHADFLINCFVYFRYEEFKSLTSLFCTICGTLVVSKTKLLFFHFARKKNLFSFEKVGKLFVMKSFLRTLVIIRYRSTHNRWLEKKIINYIYLMKNAWKLEKDHCETLMHFHFHFFNMIKKEIFQNDLKGH